VEDLGKRKVASQFVLHSLSDDHRHERLQYAKDIIKTARRKKNFLNSVVAEDETWCFRYGPTTKRQSAEWKSRISPKGKKVCLQKSQVKTMLVCFNESKGIIHYEFVHEGQAVGFFFTAMHWFNGHLLYKNCWPENKCACSIIHPTPLIYPPVIIFSSPN
jgi:hypothetical protein